MNRDIFGCNVGGIVNVPSNATTWDYGDGCIVGYDVASKWVYQLNGILVVVDGVAVFHELIAQGQHVFRLIVPKRDFSTGQATFSTER